MKSDAKLLKSRLSLTVFLLVLMRGGLVCDAQTPKAAQIADTRPLTLVRMKEGWLTPEIKRLQKGGSTANLLIDNKEVKSTRLTMPEEINQNIDLYWLDHGQLLVQTVRTSIKAIYVYEHKGKLFGYSASYVPVRDENGIKLYAGAMFIFYYYDDDGDGIFETRYSNIERNPVIPSWAMQN